MNQELNEAAVSLGQATASLESIGFSGGFTAGMAGAGSSGLGVASGSLLGAASLSPGARGERVARFAVRNLLRTYPWSWPLAWPSSPRVLSLHRWIGVGLSMLSWLVLLLGLAHLVVAAMHNQDGELGLGLDATLTGAELSGLSALLAAVGVPLWVKAERGLRRQSRRAA